MYSAVLRQHDEPPHESREGSAAGGAALPVLRATKHRSAAVAAPDIRRRNAGARWQVRCRHSRQFVNTIPQAGLALGLLMTPITAFAFFGTMDAILVLLIYVLVNIACILFFARKRRAKFSPLRHELIPALGLVITVGIVVAAVASPGPEPLVTFQSSSRSG